MIGPELRSAKYAQGATVIAAVTVVVVGLTVVFGVQAISRIRAVESQWTIYSQNATEADQTLHDVSVNLGFGGFIHFLKNYILRRDPGYLVQIEEKANAVADDLALLKQLAISDQEKAALVEIETTFHNYVAAVKTAQRAFARGLSSAEVDILVMVDDAKALKAFTLLDESFKARKDLAQAETEKALKTASSMVLLLFIVVPVVVVLGVMLILFLRRITESNTKLQELRDELGALLRQAPDAILHVAESGEVIRVNDRAVALFGYPREDFVGMMVEDLIPAALRGGHVQIRNKAFDGHIPRPIDNGADLVALTKDGREVPVEISLSFLQSGGKRIATAIVRDITDRKMSEAALRDAHDVLEKRVLNRTHQLLRRTQQLETEILDRKRAENQLVQSAKMATIGEMASGITHELNQPMNIMRMGVEAALIRIQRGNADIGQLAETLQKVEDQIVRMSDIITHMRVYSRLDTEGQAPFDPVKACQGACKLYAAQLLGDGIHLAIDLPKRSALVLGHANRLEQVILNLLSNARDAIQAQREASPHPIDARIDIRLFEDTDNDAIVIVVEDSGGGVPKDVLPHIFAPFVTTKESGRGTGLGLSISFGIIESMNGTIDVVNDSHGARFTIHLPLANAATLAHVENDSPAAKAAVEGRSIARTTGGAPTKVLVVDDEITAAHSLSDFLQEMGYLVYTAYNGKEAMQLYESDPVDVVITDLRMPLMGGTELAQRLLERNADLPIFVMTGQRADDGGEDLAQGVREVWKKPLSLTEVAQRLEKFGAGAQAEPASNG